MTITNRDPGDEMPDAFPQSRLVSAARDVVEQAQTRDENSACINLYWLHALRAALHAAGVEVEA